MIKLKVKASIDLIETKLFTSEDFKGVPILNREWVLRTKYRRLHPNQKVITSVEFPFEKLKYSELYDDKYNHNREKEDFLKMVHGKVNKIMNNGRTNRYSLNNVLISIENHVGYKSEMFDIIMDAIIKAIKDLGYDHRKYTIGLDLRKINFESRILSPSYPDIVFRADGANYKGLRFMLVENMVHQFPLFLTKDYTLDDKLSSSIRDKVFVNIADTILDNKNGLALLNKIYMEARRLERIDDTYWRDKPNLIQHNSYTSYKRFLTFFDNQTSFRDIKHLYTQVDGNSVQVNSMMPSKANNEMRFLLGRSIVLNSYEFDSFRVYDTLVEFNSVGGYFIDDNERVDVDRFTKPINKGYKTSGWYIKPSYYGRSTSEPQVYFKGVEGFEPVGATINKLEQHLREILTEYVKDLKDINANENFRSDIHDDIKNLIKAIENVLREGVYNERLAAAKFIKCEISDKWHMQSAYNKVSILSLFNTNSNHYIHEKRRKVFENSDFEATRIYGRTVYVKKGNQPNVINNTSKIDESIVLSALYDQNSVKQWGYRPERDLAIVDCEDDEFRVIPISDAGDRLLFGIELEFERYGDYVDYYYDDDDDDYGDSSGDPKEKHKVVNITNNLLSQGLPSVYTTTDGSLDDGFETKTIPVSYNVLMNSNLFDWDSYFEKLDEFEYDGENDTCGLHIHISKAHYFDDMHGTSSYWKNVGLVATLFNILMESNRNYLFNFSRRDYDQIDEWASFNYRMRENPYCEYADTFDGNIRLFERYSDKMNENHIGNRYSALNVQSRPTFEIRIFRGVDDKETLLDTIKLVKIMADKVKETWDIYRSDVDGDVKLNAIKALSEIDLEKEME